jgi:diguanylate cyclase (GGDEF)-like protein
MIIEKNVASAYRIDTSQILIIRKQRPKSFQGIIKGIRLNDNKIIRTLLDVEERDEIDIKFIKAEAGEMDLSQSDKALHENVRKARGAMLYVDMLLFLTHQYFPVEIAENLWQQILEHKATLDNTLKRDVGILVATIDYLSNIRDDIDNVVVIPEETRLAVSDIALRDSLTGLYGKGTFRAMFHEEIKRFERYREELSLILIDIDHFKRINDIYGHSIGDHVLARIGEIVLNSFREVEIVARIGGEEFAILLPQSNIEQAYKAAERVRQRIFTLFKDDYQITVSLGVASCTHSARTARDLIVRADNALYASKRSGRNRTTKAITKPSSTENVHRRNHQEKLY